MNIVMIVVLIQLVLIVLKQYSNTPVSMWRWNMVLLPCWFIVGYLFSAVFLS